MGRNCRFRNEIAKLGGIMNIKVIGTGCEKCDKLYANVQEAVNMMGCEAQVEKIEDLMEILKLLK